MTRTLRGLMEHYWLEVIPLCYAWDTIDPMTMGIQIHLWAFLPWQKYAMLEISDYSPLPMVSRPTGRQATLLHAPHQWPSSTGKPHLLIYNNGMGANGKPCPSRRSDHRIAAVAQWGWLNDAISTNVAEGMTGNWVGLCLWQMAIPTMAKWTRPILVPNL